MLTPLHGVINFDLRVVWYVTLAALARLPGFCFFVSIKTPSHPINRVELISIVRV